MKILIINVIQYNITGIANVILSHIKSLKGIDANNEIAITSYGELNEVYTDSFVNYGVGILRVDNRNKPLQYYKDLRKIIKKGMYDIIHIHGNSGTMAIEARIAKKYSNAKVIVHLHNSTCSHPLLYGPNSLLTAIMKKNADCLVACSKLAGDWLYKKDYVVLPNAIDIDKFTFNEQARQAIRSKYAINDDEFVLGHVGLFNEQKNHKFLIEVFEEYLKINPKSRLLFVGTGEKVEEIKTQAKSLGVYDKVVFAGAQQDMPAYYSALDIFVFPSLWEGLGIVNIEAQANGLAVLNSTSVPNEVKFSDRVIFKKLNDGAASWAEQIEQLRVMFVGRYAPIKQLKQCGYDVRDQASCLLQIYNER